MSPANNVTLYPLGIVILLMTVLAGILLMDRVVGKPVKPILSPGKGTIPEDQFPGTFHEPLGPPIQLFCANKPDTPSVKNKYMKARTRKKVFITTLTKRDKRKNLLTE
jgi:hypothetical protein